MSPEAPKLTLIRRAYFDLIGLPPSPEEIQVFLADRRTDAYERLLDRLLASPHYGERWGRHWMDIARFAESHGFEEDHDRPYAYHYRDFLIKALNQDMPYDQFIRWQLAGDELAPGNPLALMATGFLGAGPFPTQITEHEFETVRYDELDDMIGTMGTAMLGLTIGCARCHDHKYDPVPTRDYYRLASTFGRTIRTEIDYDPDPQGYRLSKTNWEKQHQTLVAARTRYEREHLAKPFDQWMQDGAPNAAERGGAPTANPWQVLDLTSYESKNGASFEELPDGSILAVGENPKFDGYTLTADVETPGITTLRIEALTHPSLPANGPGRSHSGQFRLRTVSVKVQPLADPESEPVAAELTSAWATNELDPGTSAQAALDSGSKTGWSLSPEGYRQRSRRSFRVRGTDRIRRRHETHDHSAFWLQQPIHAGTAEAVCLDCKATVVGRWVRDASGSCRGACRAQTGQAEWCIRNTESRPTAMVCPDRQPLAPHGRSGASSRRRQAAFVQDEAAGDRRGLPQTAPQRQRQGLPALLRKDLLPQSRGCQPEAGAGRVGLLASVDARRQ